MRASRRVLSTSLHNPLANPRAARGSLVVVNRDQNRHTQPLVHHPVFNNWDVVAKGWYIALPSSALARGRAQSVDVCGQRLVVWRGQDGRARALDAYCPHMGTDLGIGRVDGDHIRCFFHHWAFDEAGACVDVPCGEPAPKGARAFAYPVRERYGFVWVFPDREADADLVELPELEGAETTHSIGRAFTRPCHHHVNMVNGIDPQHLKTVHDIDITMSLDLDERDAKKQIDFVLRGPIGRRTWRERVVHAILGGGYAYGMRYAHGNIGALTLLKDVKLFARFAAPNLHMLYAYRPITEGVTEVQPIYVTRRRRGLFGALASLALITLTRIAYFALKNEDGAIYDNIRMNPRNLLKMDGPLTKYITWVNRLEPSVWSRELPSTTTTSLDRPAARTSLRVVDTDREETEATDDEARERAGA